MARYVVRRLARAAITLVIFQTLLFILLQALPWDYFHLARLSSAYQQTLRHLMRMDLPLWHQYYYWMKGFFTGDLGVSAQLGHTPVMRLFLNRLPPTLLFFLPGTLLGFMLGISLGKTIGWRRGSRLELGITLGGVASYTSFAPWLAFVLVNIFALWLGWLPPENIITAGLWAGSGVLVEVVVAWLLATLLVSLMAMVSLWRASLILARSAWPRRVINLLGLALLFMAVWSAWMASGWAPYALDILEHLLLPLATLVFLSFGETMLLMRTTMLDVLADDHVLVARAKGVSPANLRDRHVARIALLPVLARFIVQLPLILIGSFALERVFFWKGMGELLFQAVDMYDLPVVMGVLSLVGILMLLAHVGLDILVVWLDPRLRKPDLFSV